MLLFSVDLISENAFCAFGTEENISVQVIAFMGVIWNHLNSKRPCALMDFADCFDGSTRIVYMSSFVSHKGCLQFPGKSRHDMPNEKHVSNRLYGSHSTTATNCQVFIMQCYKQSGHIRLWNLKKTKSSKLSKLEEICFILIALKPKQR